ncbi:MAG TPA: hypothetical protein VGR62_23225 [Candidatus Binatia bacterium]|jgi:hypothetical protein|nr:hypothetical protein [Candidatus Binatia bacterium]
MARTIQQLTIFVSGPADTESEKAALRTVVDEISRRLEKTHNVTIRVIGWPDSVRPGVGADPQSELNRQFGSDFDIYVGILGSRFGAATPRHGSGTQEEFELALARFHEDTTSVRVLFYFNRGPGDLYTVDLEQLQRVRAFRDRLSGRGVVYRDFRDTAEFTQLVREHLDALVIDEWQGERWANLAAPGVAEAVALDGVATESPPCSQDAPTTIERALADAEGLGEEELGILEYVDRFNEASTAIAEVLADIATRIQRVGEETTSQSLSVDQIVQQLDKEGKVGGSRAQQDLLRQARDAVDGAAGSLEEFVSRMSPNIDKYRVYSRALFENMQRAFVAGKEFETRDDRDDRVGLVELISTIESSREQMLQLQNTIARVPALTGKFKRARKRAAAVLGELVAEMSLSLRAAQDLLSEMGGPVSIEPVLST